jgi:hypothetical protein
MSVSQVKLSALILEQDSFFTEFGLRSEYEKAFEAVSEEDFRKSCNDMVTNGALIQFDVENDGMDGVLIDHEEHGQLESQDFHIVGADTYLAVGPHFVPLVQQDSAAIAKEASSGGLAQALQILGMLPIDSSKWTGLDGKLRFTPEVQAQTIELLQRAQTQVSTLGLSNVDAAKATAYIECALMLAQLPEPEPDIIALLIKRLLIVIGTVSFAADLRGLFG